MTAPDKKSPDALDRAIAEVIRVTRISGGTGEGERWQGTDFTGRQEAHDPFPIDDAIAEILNAVVSGGLVRSDLRASGQQVRAGRWRVFESAFGRGWWGIEIDGDLDADAILPPQKIAREDLEAIVDAHNAALTPAPQPEATENYADPVSSAPQAEGLARTDDAACEALARAYDHKDAAQRGEPDPWSIGVEDEPEWVAGRIACARAGLAALSSQASCVPHAADRETQRDLSPTDAIQAPQPEGQVQRLSDAIRQACDLLAERSYGSPARSPAHNARLVLEAALAPTPSAATPTAQEAVPSALRYVPTVTTDSATPPQPSETLAEAAYLAGFMASSEGYHGEYPGIEYEHDARWCFERDAALRALKGGDHG